MQPSDNLATPFLIQLSFDHIIEGLQNIAGESGHAEVEEAKALLLQIAAHPELSTGLTTIAQVEENEALIRRLLKDYFPPALSKNEIKAIGIPYRKIVFNHTDRFKSILAAAGQTFEHNIRDFDEHQFYVLSCCIILNEFYGTHLDFGKPLFYDIPDANGVTRHYRILYNADYLDIIPTGNSVPLTAEDIDLLMDNYDDLDLWKSKFPPESWILKGFAIMTLIDVTIENAVSLFKEKLLVLDYSGFEENVASIFRSIYRIPDLKIGFTAFNQEDGRFSRFDFGSKVKSYILSDEESRDESEVLCFSSFHHVIEEKVFFAVSDTAEFVAKDCDSRLTGRLLDQDIRSFILAPVVKNNVLLGVLEVVSPRARELNSINANKLSVVMPFLTDTIDRLFADLQNQIRAFIQEKYTTIHKSVYWKFREKAAYGLAHRLTEGDNTQGDIVFPEVFPLYGQVDIKESSEARNSSVQQDLRKQLKALLALLSTITQEGEDDFSEDIYMIRSYLTDLVMPLRANTEQFIVRYLDDNVHMHLKEAAYANLPAVLQYFVQTDKESGAFHKYRRKYETTIYTINEKLAAVIDDRQIGAQHEFPHYYERFKTDGVEHNLYIGASIAPYQSFDLGRLHALRFWQLHTLCEMEQAHHEISPILPYQLGVTTLILVYNTTIAIRFRMDEKRFDVDGSYNARFEIVKKRIDKAHIKDTQERITQNGKVTIVYSSERERDEYLGYIGRMQAKGMLERDPEDFEVEDLQGVAGLKALRVSVRRR